jgi:hypothetical protein
MYNQENENEKVSFYLTSKNYNCTIKMSNSEVIESKFSFRHNSCNEIAGNKHILE